MVTAVLSHAQLASRRGTRNVSPILWTDGFSEDHLALGWQDQEQFSSQPDRRLLEKAQPLL